MWQRQRLEPLERVGERFVTRFGSLLCVNCVRGGCANRRCENFMLMSSCHAVLAACCAQIVFGVAVAIGDAKLLQRRLADMRLWRLAVSKLCWG